MTRQRCQCCGQTLPLRAVKGIPPNTVRARIYDIVRRAGESGIETAEVFNAVYGASRNGGPTSGMHALYIHVSHLNQHLRPRGQRIRAVGMKRGVCGSECGQYVLQEISA